LSTNNKQGSDTKDYNTKKEKEQPEEPSFNNRKFMVYFDIALYEVPPMIVKNEEHENRNGPKQKKNHENSNHI
jgi:hypothetical protein